MAGFTVTDLTDYVRENADRIFTAAITQAATLQYPGINIIAGIKNAESIMNFTNTAPFQAGGVCSFNASGSSVFSDRVLTVTKLKWQDTFCPETLESKFLSTKLIAGSNYDSLPFEQLIVDQVVKNITSGMEQLVWQGDTTSTGNQVLKQMNGWLKVIDAASPVYATATAAITAANVIAIFDDVYAKIPVALLARPEYPLVAFCGWDTFRKLIIALKDADNFNFNVNTTDAYKTGEITLPGSGLMVKAVHGLNTIATSQAKYNDRIVCTYPQNLVYGTDLANEYEEAKFWYSADDQNVKGSIKWKAGCEINFGSEIVTYKNS